MGLCSYPRSSDLTFKTVFSETASKGAAAADATKINPTDCLDDGRRKVGAGLVIDSELLEKDASSDESSDGDHFLPTLFSKKAQSSDVQNMNEDEQLLLKVEEFNMQQAVLRTKLRVKNNREEAIDFISKVIFMIFGLMPLELDFLSSEFRQSYLIYAALDMD